MNLYALAINALRVAPGGTQIQTKAMAAKARSDTEALGFGLQQAQKEWPVEENWYNHGATCCLIPMETITQIAEEYNNV